MFPRTCEKCQVLYCGAQDILAHHSIPLVMTTLSVLKADDVRKRFKNVIDTLRYHVATGRFSYVDRIVAAMDPSVVEETLREALRVLLSAVSSPKVAKGNPIEFDEEEKVYKPKQNVVEVEYVEEEPLDPKRAMRGAIPARARLHGRLLQVDNTWKILYTPPRLPSDKELAEFFDEIRKDLSVAKLVASLAMTFEKEK